MKANISLKNERLWPMPGVDIVWFCPSESPILTSLVKYWLPSCKLLFADGIRHETVLNFANARREK